MSTTQGIVAALKEGKIVFIHDKRGSYLAAATRQQEAVKRILELTGPAEWENAVVAIGEAPQLYDFVVRIPDLAWDIVEFTEKPLHIIYEEGKGVPEEVLSNRAIRLMLVLQDPLKDILQKLHQGLLCVPVDPKKVEEIKSDIAEALALTPQSGCQLTADRIMQLGQNGEIKFLKR